MKFLNSSLSKLTDPLYLVSKLKLQWYSNKPKLFHRTILGKSTKSSPLVDCILCVYDLDMLSTSYNVFEYLASCNYESKSIGSDFLFIIIDQTIYKNITKGTFAAAYSVENREYRLRNLIEPACKLFPACRGSIVLKNRKDLAPLLGDFSLFPEGYYPYYYQSCNINYYNTYKHVGAEFASLQVSPFTCLLASELVSIASDTPLITITLRRSKYDACRNSRLEEWSKFAVYAEEQGYQVVVIPDSENPNELGSIPNKYVHPVFSHNLELRAALYQLSHCNLGVANGPMILSTLNSKVPSTIQMNVCPDESEASQPRVWNANGLTPGDPYFWYNKKTINSTLPDTFENIRHLFLSLKTDESFN